MVNHSGYAIEPGCRARPVLCLKNAIICLVMLAAFSPASAFSHVLKVGPGRPFNSIANAVAAARPGDVIKVWPLGGDRAYRRTAVEVTTSGLTIESGIRGKFVKINGAGFNYSGRGAVPRAIFQFNPGANHCVLRGFALYGAHNHSFNGAGVRMNAANNVLVSHCYIHGNDMGIMSNGDLRHGTGADQRIEFCHITRNGSHKDPGYNHNLYLGGTSALIRGCNISHALTGHDIKSRCHITWIEYCYVHGSNNREFDLVDDKVNTAAPGSDAVILGCVISKGRGNGNHQVIHFGQDGGGAHNGTLFVIHNTIRTPWPGPVFVMSASGAHISCCDNKIIGPRGRVSLTLFVHGAKADHFSGNGNWLSAGYGIWRKTLGGRLIPWPQARKLLPQTNLPVHDRQLKFLRHGQLVTWPATAAGAGEN